jgi:hypothetical protein
MASGDKAAAPNPFGKSDATDRRSNDIGKLTFGVTVLGILGWTVVGAAIGYHAALRRGFSRTSGVVSGAPWGVLAVFLYFFDWPYLADWRVGAGLADME